MGRYDDEIVYDRVVNSEGKIKQAYTIKELNRHYDKDDIIVHIVSDKQNLFSIAQTYYGDFRKWYFIAEKNSTITNPFILPIGMELVIPRIR